MITQIVSLHLPFLSDFFSTEWSNIWDLLSLPSTRVSSDVALTPSLLSVTRKLSFYYIRFFLSDRDLSNQINEHFLHQQIRLIWAFLGLSDSDRVDEASEGRTGETWQEILVALVAIEVNHTAIWIDHWSSKQLMASSLYQAPFKIIRTLFASYFFPMRRRQKKLHNFLRTIYKVDRSISSTVSATPPSPHVQHHQDP